MGRFHDLPVVNNEELTEMIVDGAQSPSTILVECNDVRLLIELALRASKQMSSYDVFYQPNSDFYMDLEIDDFMTEEKYKEAFEDYCNYFDKHRVTQITERIKRLYNYSKNSEEIKLVDYPTDEKIILIIENFNFWDLNSQYYLIKLSEKNPNIILIGQLRSDFDFALDHIDVGVIAGRFGLSKVSLEV
jgi:hypothetical protein